MEPLFHYDIYLKQKKNRLPGSLLELLAIVADKPEQSHKHIDKIKIQR